MVKYSIGEFSKIAALTVKSLRLYHEKGILVPVEVDAVTGYRYYNQRNIETAHAIATLRAFGFSLVEIKQILSEFSDDADLKGQLQSKRKEIESKMRHFQEISQSIDTILRQEGAFRMTKESQFEIEEKNVDTLLIAGYRMKGAYHEIGTGFAALGKSVGRHIRGKGMGLYYDGEYKEVDADFEACFPVRKGTSTESVSVRQLTGGKAVCLIHKGPYDTLHLSYKRLFEYLTDNSYKLQLPTREIYQKGPGMVFKGNPKNYLTEIQMFIQPA